MLFCPMNIYYETLSEVVDAIVARAAADRIELKSPAEVQEIFSGHIAYEQDRSGNFEIAALNGKPSRKWFHAQVYRMASGRYELVTYVL